MRTRRRHDNYVHMCMHMLSCMRTLRALPYKYLLCKSLECLFLLCFYVGEHASGLARACVLCILIEETSSWSTNHTHIYTHIHMHAQTHRSKVDDLKQQVGEVSKKYCFLKSSSNSLHEAMCLNAILKVFCFHLIDEGESCCVKIFCFYLIDEGESCW